jgi:hypothetical protein
MFEGNDKVATSETARTAESTTPVKDPEPGFQVVSRIR